MKYYATIQESGCEIILVINVPYLILIPFYYTEGYLKAISVILQREFSYT